MEEVVYRVTAVELSRTPSDPPGLQIRVRGETRTSGWTAPELIPRPRATDGIYELDFKAQWPAGLTFPALTPIEAVHVLQTIPPDLAGVRVFAEENDQQVLL